MTAAPARAPIRAATWADICSLHRFLRVAGYYRQSSSASRFMAGAGGFFISELVWRARRRSRSTVCMVFRRTDHMLREAIDQKLRRRIFVGFEDPRVSFEMFEHAVLIAALQQERLHRDGRQVGDNDGEFLWDAFGIRDVGHNETCHAGQQ